MRATARPTALLALLCGAGTLSCHDPAGPGEGVRHVGPVPGFGNGSFAVPAAAPAMRILWQNPSTSDRSIWMLTGTSWDGTYASLPQCPVTWLMAGAGDFNAA